MYKLFFGFLFFISATLFAMNWPADTVMIEENFGMNNNGRPALGMSFSETDGIDGAIRSADKGELVFFHDEEDSASRLPSPLGNWQVISGSSGLMNIYGRYGSHDSIAERGNGDNQIETLVEIARLGSSGKSKKNGFYFAFYDKKERCWINPAAILPPVVDTKQPELTEARLTNTEGQVFVIGGARTGPSRIIPQGHYSIWIDAYDTGELSAPRSNLAPKQASAFVNGAEAGTLNFESFSARDGRLMVYRNSLLPADEVYGSPPFYEIGEFSFPRGQANLEILVQDAQGNTLNVSYRLIIE
jgi:hypothetical protein